MVILLSGHEGLEVAEVVGVALEHLPHCLTHFVQLQVKLGLRLSQLCLSLITYVSRAELKVQLCQSENIRKNNNND